MKKSIRSEFNKNGFVVLKNVLNKSEVDRIRKKALEAFKNFKKTNRMLMPSDVLIYIPEVLEIQKKDQLITALFDLFGKGFYYVNDFQLHKNTSQVKSYSGWHIDGGSQVSQVGDDGLRFYSSDYKFAKIGVCLQDDSPWGTSISVSKYFFKSRIINSVLHKILSSKTMPKFIRDFLTRDCDSIIKSGDIYIFDARLLHRSSLSSKVINRGNNTDYHISDDAKLTIYFEAGTKRSAEYFYENSKYRMIHEELKSNQSINEKYFCDYLRFRPSTYEKFDPSYLESLQKKGVNILFASNNLINEAEDVFNKLS
jgi:hypothetical protein